MGRILRLVVFAVTLTVTGVPFVPSAQAADTAIVDTLGDTTPTTTFSVFGAGGQTIFGSQYVGPRFTLLQESVITEIGAFVNNCGSIIGGVPQCPDTLPLVVQVRPSVAGVPDPSTVVATLELSHDDDPLVVSYESASSNLRLAPGEYFALFAPQNDDVGFLLSGAGGYQAGIVTMGFLDPTSGNAFASEQFGAVRIVGHSLDAADLLDDLVNAVMQQDASPTARLARILSEASRALSTGNEESTCCLLDEFVRATAALSGRALTPDQAAAWIDAADDIHEALNC
jgi:hypothetical protein